jgi:hypothetical protein
MLAAVPFDSEKNQANKTPPSFRIAAGAGFG